MKEALEKFLAQKKQEGLTHFQAMALWKTSPERKAIVDGMDASERKRRRYD